MFLLQLQFCVCSPLSHFACFVLSFFPPFLLPYLFQVPQFLLDHMWGKREACKIICTQPRRISAISGVCYPTILFYFFVIFCPSFSLHFVIYWQSKVCASDWMYLYLVQLLRESHLKGEKMLVTVLVTRSESIFFLIYQCYLQITSRAILMASLLWCIILSGLEYP